MYIPLTVRLYRSASAAVRAKGKPETKIDQKPQQRGKERQASILRCSSLVCSISLGSSWTQAGGHRTRENRCLFCVYHSTRLLCCHCLATHQPFSSFLPSRPFDPGILLRYCTNRYVDRLHNNIGLLLFCFTCTLSPGSPSPSTPLPPLWVSSPYSDIHSMSPTISIIPPSYPILVC